jgi:energy-coupling factor transporter transmembrane protein EcfT
MAYSLTAAGAHFRQAAARRTPHGLIEAFILVQFLWGVLLFLPGAQAFRMYVRVLPYASSILLFAFYYGGRSRHRLPAAGKLLVLALLLLCINLAHPQTQLTAGLAQCAFQFAIAAPVFWAGKAVRDARFLGRLLWLVFLVSAAGALVGLLQIYFPQYFMPPEFSALAQSMNARILEALSYEGAGGQRIVRPPGLSDMPGGAAIAGMMTAVMGLAFGLRREWPGRRRGACLALAVVGMVTLYLTQVRSLTLLMMAAVVALCAVAFKRGERWESAGLASAGLGVVAVAFVWATAVGGRSVAERFFSLAESGLFNSFQANRGFFIEHTLGELLFEYPLGAGLARWGMMNVYFADPHAADAGPLWAEVQLTGWLYDGGVLMWLFYGGAVVAALVHSCRLAVSAKDPALMQAARLVLCLNLGIAGTTLAGPSFNTQLGIQFWFLAAALHGAAAGQRARAAAALRPPEGATARAGGDGAH